MPKRQRRGKPTNGVLPSEMLTPALQVTANPAARLGLRRKGAIAVGIDADLLLFRPADLELRCVHFAISNLGHLCLLKYRKAKRPSGEADPVCQCSMFSE